MLPGPNETACQATGLTVLGEIGDVTGDWIDAIWEAGHENPGLFSHIHIRERAGVVRIEGSSYSADDVNKSRPLKPVGDFSSKHVVLLAERDGFYYQYSGHEYREKGRRKSHSGVGFYRFRKGPSLDLTFEGSFLVHEGILSRHVEGRQLTADERAQFANSGNKAILRKFLREKRKRKVPLFGEELFDRLQRHVGPELMELTSNYEANNPNATAFLLRKILEKLLYFVFSKNRMIDRIKKDLTNPAFRLVGLEDMINIAKNEVVDHNRILLEQTANGVLSAKFLGDMAAHSPTASIDKKMIKIAMPFMLTAYCELVAKIPTKT